MAHPSRIRADERRRTERSDRVSCDPNNGLAAGSAQEWPLCKSVRLSTTMASAVFGQNSLRPSIGTTIVGAGLPGLVAATRLSAGLPRRDLEATHCRNARADLDESGTPGPF
jgi:hypothetical protein